MANNGRVALRPGDWSGVDLYLNVPADTLGPAREVGPLRVPRGANVEGWSFERFLRPAAAPKGVASTDTPRGAQRTAPDEPEAVRAMRRYLKARGIRRPDEA